MARFFRSGIEYGHGCSHRNEMDPLRLFHMTFSKFRRISRAMLHRNKFGTIQATLFIEVLVTPHSPEPQNTHEALCDDWTGGVDIQLS